MTMISDKILLCFKPSPSSMHECSFKHWKEQQHCPCAEKSSYENRCMELRFDKFCQSEECQRQCKRTVPVKEEDLPNTSSGVSSDREEEKQSVKARWDESHKPIGRELWSKNLESKFNAEDLGCLGPGSVVKVEHDHIYIQDKTKIHPLTFHYPEVPDHVQEMQKLMGEMQKAWIDQMMLSPQIIAFKDGDPITHKEFYNDPEHTRNRPRLDKVRICGRPKIRWEPDD